MNRCVILLVALTLALAGCSDDAPDPVAPAGTPSAAGSPTSPPSVTPSASGAGAVEPTAPAVAFPANAAPDTEEARGGALTVVAVRVAKQDGYDRVVFELAGEGGGEPGWRVEYTSTPTAQGSGDPVDVDGPSTLAVLLTGIGLPGDTGADEVSTDPTLPGGLAVVRDVVLGSTFEGQYEAFIGTVREAPFRVFRLSNPARVVVDVRHS